MGIFDFFKAKPQPRKMGGRFTGLTLVDYSATLYQAAGRQIAKSNHHGAFCGIVAAKSAANTHLPKAICR